MTELSGLEVLALVKEINSSLRGTYVNNIYSIGRAQVLRFRKPGEGDIWMVASPEQGAWVSGKVAERAVTTPFTTSLRGELDRMRFVSVEQPGLDRVFDFTLGQGDSLRHLIIEMMPPGNMVVTDGEARILVVEKEVRAPARRLVRGGTYAPPAQKRKSPVSVSVSEIEEAVRKEKTAGKAIGRTVALPGKYVKEVLGRLGVDEASSSDSLKGREEEVTKELRKVVEEARERPTPCMCETQSGADVFAVTPVAFKLIERGDTLSELCDKALLGQAVSGAQSPPQPEEERRREIEATIERLHALEASQKRDATKAREDARRASSSESFEDALRILAEAEIAPRTKPASKAAVASLLFDKAKQLDRKAGEAAGAAADLSKKRDRVKIRPGAGMKSLKRERKEWYERFRWFFTGEGRLAVGGRDTQSNSILVRRHLDANDSVYHADLFGSPFFVLKGGKEQTPDEIAEVAQATVAFSSAWKTGLGSADAYWVVPEQVSTSAPSGEYLAKGSFLIRGKKNFVPRNVVELAIGVDSEGRVVSGPERAISRSSIGYVLVKPHREKSSETAKRVKKDLEELTGGVLKVPLLLDDVVRMLPAGGGKVFRRRTAAPP